VPVQSGALASNVNVFSGSGGWFYVCAHNGPAVMTPFGMVRLGPDTACMLMDKNGLNTSGYYYGDKQASGIQPHAVHRHRHAPRLQPAHLAHRGLACGQTARPAQGKALGSLFAQPGNRIPRILRRLPSGDEVLAELTASPHAGFHRYTFKKDEPPHLILDLSSVLENRHVLDGYLAIAPRRTRSRA